MMNQLHLTITLIATLISTHLSYEHVVTSFSQNDAGNCASIAVIKAVIITYGRNQVFALDSISDADNYLFTLKDGKKLSVLKDDSKFIKPKARFWPLTKDKEIYDLARMCYVVMVVNKASELKRTSNKPISYYYKQAVKELNDGENTDLIYGYLGIPDSLVEPLEFSDKGTTNPEDFKDKSTYILYNENHAAVADKGTYDEYGRLVSIKDFQKNHCTWRKKGKYFWAYRFKK